MKTAKETKMSLIEEIYGLSKFEKKKKEKDKPKSKWYKLGEKIAKDAIKKVEKKERERSIFEKYYG